MTPLILTAADALGKIEPVEWQVDQLLPTASVALFYGAPGSKKTYASLDMALCVCMGKPWLGEYNTKQGAVLIIDEESGPRRLLRRMGEVLRGYCADETTPIYATSLESFNFWDSRAKHGRQALEDTIIMTQARVVIIDALADVMLGGDENTVKDSQKVFHALRSVAESTGVTIILIHHSLKNGNGYRGSSAIFGALDVAIEVESEPNEMLVKFKTSKARDSEPVEWAGECHWGPDEFWMSGMHPVSGSGMRYTKAQKLILNHLGKCPNGATIQDLRTVTGYADGTLRNALTELMANGVVVSTNVSTVGTTVIYTIDPLGYAANPL